MQWYSLYWFRSGHGVDMASQRSRHATNVIVLWKAHSSYPQQMLYVSRNTVTTLWTVPICTDIHVIAYVAPPPQRLGSRTPILVTLTSNENEPIPGREKYRVLFSMYAFSYMRTSWKITAFASLYRVQAFGSGADNVKNTKRAFPSRKHSAHVEISKK